MRNGFISRNRALDDKDVSLAIPAEVLEIKGNAAKVDFAESILRGVSLVIVGARVRPYALVYSGYAVHAIDRKAAMREASTIRMIRCIICWCQRFTAPSAGAQPISSAGKNA